MTQVFAHRGNSCKAPENTIPAFEEAAAAHADGVELDVHLSADGHLVVIHDDKVDRTTGSSGTVHDMTLEQLQALDASLSKVGYAGAKIPTLEEVYRLLQPTGLLVNVELKEKAYWHGFLVLPKVLAAEEACGMCGRVFYSSFYPRILRELKRRSPKSQTALLYKAALPQVCRFAAHLPANAVHPKMALLQSGRLVPHCHAAHLAVRPWTVDQPADLVEAFRQKVDAVITNQPHRALSLRNTF
ncbi:MAG: glycerophosphodiester phosphodiesterase [Oscillospiraceae bacterium]|jgi:glycerophosphoryl diester phosphodiesterase|nr:glycerophosphodiester phosphodiesterase [Oscillospiraceae bacterium]